MKQTKLNDSGVAHLGLILMAVLVIAAVGFVGYRVSNSKKVDNQKVASQSDNKDSSSEGSVTWMYDGAKWNPSATPPKCDDPVTFTTQPVDSSVVKGILYPGQRRGGNYKPHGGFQLKSPSNNVEVKAIMDGKVVGGSRYIEAGEVQYMFTIVNDCGIAYRYDHLLELSPAFKELAATLPEPKVDDSRSTKFTNPIQVKAGDLVATSVGFRKTANYSFDLGVYDYRQPNEAEKSGMLKNVGLPSNEQSGYAVCWIGMFEGANYSSLPAVDGQAGKSSDYCK